MFIFRQFWCVFNKIEIWTKFIISPIILTAQKRQTTFWKCQDQENFVVIVSRIIYVKVGWQLNVTKKLKFKDDFQIVLLLSCFVGHPVSLPRIETENQERWYDLFFYFRNRERFFKEERQTGLLSKDKTSDTTVQNIFVFLPATENFFRSMLNH